MTCSYCVMSETERDALRQSRDAWERLYREAERDRDRLREALRALIIAAELSLDLSTLEKEP